jgi:THO complex subunit 1
MLTTHQLDTVLYKTFWFLQYPFSKPAVFSEAEMFKAFQHSVNSVLPVLSEATKKERTFAGSKTTGGTKRKRDENEGSTRFSYAMQEQHKDYAFAKYLSSPELLELEIADTNFRRQFLFQLLILLQHLRSFTEAEKAKRVEPRNRSLHIDFTLSEVGENWVKEVNGRVMLELRTTVPEGRAFEEMIRVILEREQNWVGVPRPSGTSAHNQHPLCRFVGKAHFVNHLRRVLFRKT